MPFSRLVPNQKFMIIPEFKFESGAVIQQVPVAYKTWGVLNAEGDNCMLICHPLSCSVDVEDWWADLMGSCPSEGKGKAIDEFKFFIICLNVMGSPYGSASPLTTNPKTGTRYGPEFPLATIRDDCRLHKMVLDDLGVKSVAVCIGGSMGGMHVYEWALYGPEYVKLIVPIAAPAKNSAWSISWAEAQRQSIFTDPMYNNGSYALDSPPLQGMTTARMTAMLTYRTPASYERRFGRTIVNYPDNPEAAATLTESHAASAEVHRCIHNQGHRHLYNPLISTDLLTTNSTESFSPRLGSPTMDRGFAHSWESENSIKGSPPVYSAHSYLHYQADKFNKRFDANCYIHLSRKMDFHDVSFRRGPYEDIVKSIRQPTLVCAIMSDVLYPFYELKALADLLPNSELVSVKSDEGHDGFLVEYEQINDAIVSFMQRHEPTRRLLAREDVAVIPKTVPHGNLFASW